MLKKIKYLAIIPVRANSKRIKNKNFKKIKNKKLFEITYEVAKKIKKIDEIVFSTNDEKIINYCKLKKISYVKRPESLCRSESKTEDAINHTLDFYKKKLKTDVENTILLQVTSPMRSKNDIEKSLEIYETKKVKSVFSAYLKKLFVWRLDKLQLNSLNYDYKNRKMTQKMSDLIIENGAIYITNVKSFRKKHNRIIKPTFYSLMDEERSIDIDTVEDLRKIKKIFIF